MAEKISKIVLDDSGYLPRLKGIGNTWVEVAQNEADALAASKTGMAERVEGLDVLDKAFVSTINRVKQVKAADEAHAKTVERSSKITTTYNKIVAKVSDTFKGWISSAKKAKKTEEEIAAIKLKNRQIYEDSVDALKEEIDQTTILGTNVGQLGRTIKAAMTVGKAWIAQLGITKIALMATGVGAFVVVLGSLISFLKGTVEGQDFVNRKLAAAKAIFASVKDVAIGMGKAIFDAISNPIQAIRSFGKGIVDFIVNPAQKARDMWNSLKNAVRGVVEDASADAVAAEALARREQILRDKLRGQEVEAAKIRTEAEKYKAVMDDVSKTLAEREDAAKKFHAAEIQLMNDQLALAQENLDIIRAKNALATSGNEDLDAERDAELALLNLQRESLGIQREGITKISGLRKEAHDKALAEQKARDDEAKRIYEERITELENLKSQYQGFSQTILDAILELDLAEASPLEELRIKEAETMKRFAKMREEFKTTSKAALLAGLVTQDEVDLQLEYIDRLEKAAKDKFAEERDTFKVDIDKLPVKVGQVDLEIDGIDIPEIDPAAFEPLERTFAEGMQTALDNAAEALNTEKFQVIQNGFADITSLFVSGIDSQIAKIDELIAAQDENISELEDQIDREKSAKDDNLAHSLEVIQEQLDKEKANREKAIKQRQALEQKAAKAQLINDIVQQSSSLITASANIFKAMSSIPVVGVPLAIALIATMFGAFAKAKIDAAKAAKLYKGTTQIDRHIKTNVGPKSDLYGQGYALVDPDTGEDMKVRLSGREGLVRESVAQGPNRDFIDELNTNDKWRTKDIRKAIAAGEAAQLKKERRSMIRKAVRTVQKAPQLANSAVRHALVHNAITIDPGAVYKAQPADIHRIIEESKRSIELTKRTVHQADKAVTSYIQAEQAAAAAETQPVQEVQTAPGKSGVIFRQYLTGEPTHVVTIEDGIRDIRDV